MIDTITTLLEEEHKNILRMVTTIRAICAGILEGADVDDADFREIIDWVRNYSDKHHHGKEEDVLFKEMVDRLGPAAENLVTHGMLVEHDLGRFHIRSLEEALDAYKETHDVYAKLDIVVHACGWADLLKRHAEKENAAVYPFARRGLSEEVLASVHERNLALEEEATKAGIQEHYLAILDRLEQKYAARA